MKAVPISDRRKETRIEVAAAAALTPIASLDQRIRGEVVDLSPSGVRIRVSGSVDSLPKVGELYRVLSSQDRMLCRVAHTAPGDRGADIGFRIVYWNELGELSQTLEHQGLRRWPGQTMRELAIPRWGA